MINDVKTIIALITAVILATGFYHTYKKAYSIGYQQAQVECVEAKQQLQEQLQEKITSLEQSLSQTQAKANERQNKLGKDISNITRQLKNQPITIVENGKCLPSEVFIDSINQAILRANEK